MRTELKGSFSTRLKALREDAGFTQEELAAISGLSVHAVSALERGERKRPHVETLRALSAALDLNGLSRDAFMKAARSGAQDQSSGDDGSHGALPLALTTLVGRDDDVLTLGAWLSDPAIRLVTLTGPGGVGKTRLAIEAAQHLAGESTRVVFVSLAPIWDPALVPATIAEAFGLADLAATDLARGIRAAGADRAVLLVLDNFEQVLDAAPIVTSLLGSVSSLKVLVTSRAPLHIRGEREYPVRPLSLHTGHHASRLADLPPAVRLFVNRVQDVVPAFALTSSLAPAVTAICRHLDALPLALELAAPWMKVLSTDDLLHRLERGVLVSKDAARDLPARQRTMTATVAWSYQLLDATEQRAFKLLGVLPCRFPLEAATTILGGGADPAAAKAAALDAVASLVDKSLLVRDDSDADCPRYRMLETVRAYASSLLDESGDRAEALEGLTRYAHEQAALADLGLVGPSQAEWLDRVQADFDTYRAALAALLDQERVEKAADISQALFMFLLIRGHVAEGLRWYERIADHAAAAPHARAKALVGTAMMLYAQGEVPRARAALEAAMPLATATGDGRVVASVETLFGHVEHASGNFAAARDRFMRGAAGFAALGLSWGRGAATSGRAGVELAAGNVAVAEQLMDDATAFLQTSGRWFVTPVLCFRAVLAIGRGKPDDAIRCLRESLTYIRALRDKYAFVYALLPLAAAARLKGDDVWTARILGARDAVIERTGLTVVVQMVTALEAQAEQDVRARLGADQWTRAYEEGRTTSIDALLSDVDRLVVSC